MIFKPPIAVVQAAAGIVTDWDVARYNGGVQLRRKIAKIHAEALEFLSNCPLDRTADTHADHLVLWMTRVAKLVRG